MVDVDQEKVCGVDVDRRRSTFINRKKTLGKENEEERPLFQILFPIVDCLNITAKNFEKEIFSNLNKIF